MNWNSIQKRKTEFWAENWIEKYLCELISQELTEDEWKILDRASYAYKCYENHNVQWLHLSLVKISFLAMYIFSSALAHKSVLNNF